MADREMSYDLDGVFATRNQGQLVAAVPTQTRMLRTPGLVRLNSGAPGRMPFHGLAADMLPGPAAEGNAAGAADKTIDLPIVGPVKKSTLLIGGLLAVAAWGMLRSR